MRRERELRYHEVGDEALAPMNLDLDHVGGAAGVQVRGRGEELIPGHATGEHVELHLDRREVVASRQVAKCLPGRDAVRERYPGAAVHEAAGMEVSPVHDHPATAELVVDLERLNPHVRREAPGDPFPDRLDRDLRTGVAHGEAVFMSRRLRRGAIR